MIILILVVCIILTVLGLILIDKERYGTGGACSSLGVIGFVISFITVIVLSISVSQLRVIDDKIIMYQEENAKIETQIAETVGQYQQYETNIFTEVAPNSSITLVALYPELKSDTLVQKQIEVYINNNEIIKSLNEAKINGDVLRWWLYFGGNK